jgi:hypothetical protein
MKRLRRELIPIAPWIAALCALVVAAPSAPLVYHHHAGGDVLHVHDDASLLAALFAAPEAPERPQQPLDRRPHLERPNTANDGHYHQPQHLQRGVLPRLAVVTVSTPLLDRPTPAVALAPERAPAAPQSRGPPALPVA